MIIPNIFPFIETVVESQLSSKDAEEVQPKLATLRSKISDKRLYLAVVGEFSSGKSTFINALLGMRLLKEAVMPTTACATYIQNAGTALSLNVQFFDESKFQATQKDFTDIATYLRKKHKLNPRNMQEVIDILTSDQNVARLVKNLSINVPNAKIPRNIVIIDTPGFNPGSSSVNNHYEITQHVVEHVADAAIILTPSEQAMSATLIRFLRTTLQRCLHRCTYVVTRMDMMDEWSRGDVKEYARNRIATDLGISNPHLYAESAITMLPANKIPDAKKNDWKFFQQEFRKFEDETWQWLQRHKEIMLHEHTALLTHEIAQLCQSRLQHKVETLHETAAFLNAHRIENITTVCNEMFSQSIDAMERELATLDISLYGAEARCKTKAEQMIMDTKYSTSDFNTELIPEIIKMLNQEAKKRLAEISTALNNKVTVCAHRQVARMQQVFASHYDQFPALRPQERMPDTDLVKIETPYVSFQSVISSTKSELTNENIAMVGSGVAGAIIASLIFGPLAIGLGGLIGSLFGSKDEKIRKQAVELVTPEISSYFAALKVKLRNEIQRTKLRYRNMVRQFAGDHLATYGQAVTALIKKHENDKTLINNQIAELNKTITSLGNLQGDIEYELAILKQKR